MSNLSCIGLSNRTEDEFHHLIEKAAELAQPIQATNGTYLHYIDRSGAELWIQINKKRELIGANPHFRGKSKRKVALTEIIERQETEMDGAFYAWADPQKNDPESGAYPFVFDVPDFRTGGKMELPRMAEIQLVAFAHELALFKSEQEFSASQDQEIKFASQFFIPSGLFTPGMEPSQTKEAYGIFAGIIREWEKKTNALTGESFYWMLVDTLGGPTDIVCDLRFCHEDPTIGGVAKGQFWLSGRLLNPNKSWLTRLFGS